MSKKYWDIKPQPQKKKSKPSISLDDFEKIVDKLKSWHKEDGEVIPYRCKFEYVDGVQPPDAKCLHKSCPTCHGSGRNIMGGMCIHMISCKCPSCSPTMMMSHTTLMQIR